MENKEKGLRWFNKNKTKMLLLYFEKKIRIYSPKNGTKCTEAKLKEIIIEYCYGLNSN